MKSKRSPVPTPSEPRGMLFYSFGYLFYDFLQFSTIS